MAPLGNGEDIEVGGRCAGCLGIEEGAGLAEERAEWVPCMRLGSMPLNASVSSTNIVRRGTAEMTQRGKLLACEHEDLSLIPRTQVEKEICLPQVVL